MKPMEEKAEQIKMKLNEWNAEIDALEQKAARLHQSKEVYEKHIDDLNLKLFNGRVELQKLWKRLAA